MTTRRTFLTATLKAAGAFALAPAIVRPSARRPAIPYGVAAGDVSGDRAIVWSRTDRPARMLVEWSTTESFRDARRLGGPVTGAAQGFTARVDLSRLPPGQRIVYRVRFEDLADGRNSSEPVTGSFVTPSGGERDVSFAWSADTAGQGWGIDRDRGGMRMYETIRKTAPDFFVHCGDTIYADGPLPQEILLPDGSVWRNIVTPEKSKVAETLDEFRGNHLYNLLDENVRRFNAEVSQIVLWDDHEVKNNWYPGMSLDDDERYAVKDVGVLAAHARQAFLEHCPLRLTPPSDPRIYRTMPFGPLLDVFALDFRSYRAANSGNRQPTAGPETAHAGPQQLAWLEQALRASTATWKIVASDLPIGLSVRDGDTRFEAIANAEHGPPLGREHEIAALLSSIHRHRVRNVVWITADVHYAAAHHYHPERARFGPFTPFWEFVAGPLHAGTGRPIDLDGTFGPEVRFLGVPPGFDAFPGPAAGLQFFGTVRIAARSRVMTVDLRDLTGASIYTVDLEPDGA